jgi:hypothetical protein
MLVPVADTTPNHEWNQQVKDSGILLQPAVQITTCYHGTHFKIDDSKAPVETDGWEEGRRAWANIYGQEPPPRVSMNDERRSYLSLSANHLVGS